MSDSRHLLSAEREWVRGQLTDFAHRVGGSLVPSVYDRYLRLTHPFFARPWAPLRWSEAAPHDFTMTADATLDDLLSVMGRNGGAIESPHEGSLYSTIARRLIRTMGLVVPDQAWIFGTWDGYGSTVRQPTKDHVFVALPRRRYTLVIGRPEALDTKDKMFEHGPNLAWALDHSVFVCTEIGMTSTYIGCGNALADRLNQDDEIELFDVGADSPVV